VEVDVNSAQKYLVEEELEYYRDGRISRRDFLRHAALLGVGSAVALAMADAVSPSTARAAVTVAQQSPFHIPEGHPAVATDYIQYHGTDGAEIRAYMAWPVGAGTNRALPGVTVCHENRGLNPHIEDVARRFAVQGYVAIAPDLPSRLGTPTSELSEDEVVAAFRALTPEQNAQDFVVAVDILRAHPAVDESKLAATGYCFGGGVTWRLVTESPWIRAAAPFYGSNPPLEAVPNIRASVLGVYGELDERINEGIPAVRGAMEAAGVVHRITIYPNSPHAFHADGRDSYRPDTARQAWIDTLNWFAEHLGLPAPNVM
jgi:carboxymethylenebutenolidase